MFNVFALASVFLIVPGIPFYLVFPAIGLAFFGLGMLSALIGAFTGYRKTKQRAIRKRMLSNITFVLCILAFTQVAVFRAYWLESLNITPSFAADFALFSHGSLLIMTLLSYGWTHQGIGHEQGYMFGRYGIKREDDTSMDMSPYFNSLSWPWYVLAVVVTVPIVFCIYLCFQGVGWAAAAWPRSWEQIGSLLIGVMLCFWLFANREIFARFMLARGYESGLADGILAREPNLGEKLKNDTLFQAEPNTEKPKNLDEWVDEDGNPIDIVRP